VDLNREPLTNIGKVAFNLTSIDLFTWAYRFKKSSTTIDNSGADDLIYFA